MLLFMTCCMHVAVQPLYIARRGHLKLVQSAQKHTVERDTAPWPMGLPLGKTKGEEDLHPL